MKLTERSVLLACLLACAPLTGGCASSTALRAAVADRDAEIRELRDERALLKERVQTLSRDRDNLEVALNEASMRLTERPEEPAAPEAAPAFPELDEMGITYGMRDGHVVINLPATITFASGEADLSSQGQSAVDAVAKRLKQEFGEAVYHIEGHTDSDPIRRSGFSSNRELSVARALAVLTHLVEQCAVPDEQCVVVGHSQYRPVAANQDDAGKAQNRRVEIVVHEPAR